MIIVFLLIVFISIILHEYVHGWLAYKLGDPAPKAAGRITLNPLVHIDLFGTIILPILLLLVPTLCPIGFAKAAPINAYHFKNPKRDIILVAIAGPLTNFFIALGLTLLLKIKIPNCDTIFAGGVIINIALLLFNLVPLYPLDGSKILLALMPHKFYHRYINLSKRLLFIMFILIICRITKIFELALFPFANFIFSIFKIGIVL